jgi:hypothetical protein
MIATKTYENEKPDENEKLIADAIVDAFAKAFGIKPGEIYTHSTRDKRGWRYSFIFHWEARIGYFIWGPEAKKILIGVDGPEGLAEVVANNLKANKKIKALVNERYVIDIDYDHRTYGYDHRTYR